VRPLFVLSALLSRQRYENIAQRLTEAPFFPNFRFAFERGIAGDSIDARFTDVGSLLAADVMERIPFSPEEVREWVTANRNRVLEERLRRAYFPFPGLETTPWELRSYFREFRETSDRGTRDLNPGSRFRKEQ
jgi:hypothetical protein